MTTFLARRHRPATARPRIVSVSNYWRTAGPQQGRQVVVRLPDGRTVEAYVPDEHPALLSFLGRSAVAA